LSIAIISDFHLNASVQASFVLKDWAIKVFHPVVTAALHFRLLEDAVDMGYLIIQSISILILHIGGLFKLLAFLLSFYEDIQG
jgi:hypothetical protein